MVPMLPRPPRPDAAAGRAALLALVQGRGFLAALAALHARLGDVFQLPFPGFSPVVLAGPEAARFVFVEARQHLLWRNETDPVARLLRHGLLVEDGQAHQRLRALMAPALHRRLIEARLSALVAAAREVAAEWHDGQGFDLLEAMRRIALLSLARTLFDDDIGPHLPRLWRPLLRTLAYIAPGPWLLWPAMPRPGYARAVATVHGYLRQLIAQRRSGNLPGRDLVSLLIAAGLDDDLIRDQLLTMLIAGHDTVTAGLTWAIYALARHPHVAAQVRAELDAALGGRPPDAHDLQYLPALDRAIKETLRLYPPIHVSNRVAAADLAFGGRRIPAGSRVLFSIYVTHRHPAHWHEPQRFDPARFQGGPQAAFTYLPFGGGPRFCIGAAMAQIEMKAVLSCLLQQFDFRLPPGETGMRMGAKLEPARGLRAWVTRRRPHPRAAS
jgi:cytochrome P450